MNGQRTKGNPIAKESFRERCKIYLQACERSRRKTPGTPEAEQSERLKTELGLSLLRTCEAIAERGLS